MTETEQGNNRYKIRIPCFSIVPKIESNLNRIVPRIPSITDRIVWDTGHYYRLANDPYYRKY
jgi:hypothetical protein